MKFKLKPKCCTGTCDIVCSEINDYNGNINKIRNIENQLFLLLFCLFKP
jgi:hypothetical protein